MMADDLRFSLIEAKIVTMMSTARYHLLCSKNWQSDSNRRHSQKGPVDGKEQEYCNGSEETQSQ